jgi:hypothetical protein
LPLFTTRFLKRASCKEMARRSRRLTVLFRGIFTVFRFVAGLVPA